MASPLQHLGHRVNLAASCQAQNSGKSIVAAQLALPKEVRCHVRFGSLGDMAALFGDVRFTPESGHSLVVC